MNDRKDVLNNFYTNDCDEDTRLQSKHGKVEFIISTNYIDKYLKDGDKILEVGAGTGKYSIHYASKGYDVTSIEFVENNLKVLKSKITSEMKIRAEQGDAIDLSRFKDNTFDITLILGPLYHLYDADEIDKCIDEAIRVTKVGGKVFFAFLPNDSVVIDWILKKHHFDRKGISFDDNFEFVKKLEEVFVTFYIDEFKNIVDKRNITPLNMVATDNMSHHLKEVVDELDDFEFNEWIKYSLSIAERPDLQGFSNHMLYIAEKNS